MIQQPAIWWILGAVLYCGAAAIVALILARLLRGQSVNSELQPNEFIDTVPARRNTEPEHPGISRR
jgi:hypothetical protein